MIQWLRALATLREDLGSILKTQFFKSSPRNPTTSSDLLGYQAHTWYTDIHAGQIPMYINLNKNKNCKNILCMYMLYVYIHIHLSIGACVLWYNCGHQKTTSGVVLHWPPSLKQVSVLVGGWPTSLGRLELQVYLPF